MHLKSFFQTKKSRELFHPKLHLLGHHLTKRKKNSSTCFHKKFFSFCKKTWVMSFRVNCLKKLSQWSLFFLPYSFLLRLLLLLSFLPFYFLLYSFLFRLLLLLSFLPFYFSSFSFFPFIFFSILFSFVYFCFYLFFPFIFFPFYQIC